VSLGYVKLFNGVAQRVNHADSAEFWQVRTVALKLRDASKEARLAFSEGNLQSFDAASLIEPSDRKVAALAMKDVREPEAMVATAAVGSPLSFLSSWLPMQDPASSLSNSHDNFTDASIRFSLEYNRELTRLINDQR